MVDFRLLARGLLRSVELGILHAPRMVFCVDHGDSDLPLVRKPGEGSKIELALAIPDEPPRDVGCRLDDALDVGRRQRIQREGYVGDGRRLRQRQETGNRQAVALLDVDADQGWERRGERR